MSHTNLCPKCGVSFKCGASTGGCWCSRLPAILPPDPTASCLCPDCLAKSLAQRIQQRIETLPFADALAFARQHASGQQALEHIDYTIEDGAWVFTRWYLLKVGSCCGNGCRNCPYPKKPTR